MTIRHTSRGWRQDAQKRSKRQPWEVEYQWRKRGMPKKRAPKPITHTRRGWRQDQQRCSRQPWEIFYRWSHMRTCGKPMFSKKDLKETGKTAAVIAGVAIVGGFIIDQLKFSFSSI